MLNRYSIQFPTTGGPEVRNDIVSYIDGVRAALGVALLNQAWLEQKYEPNAVYSKNIQDSSIKIAHQSYNWIGASYPTPAGKPSKFIHRIGTSDAMVDASKWLLPGEKGRILKTQSRSTVDALVNLLTEPNSNAWEGQTIQQYMAAHGIVFSFKDPASVRREIAKERMDGTRWEVRYEEISIQGNSKVTRTIAAYSEVCNLFKCSVSDRQRAIREDLEATQYMYYLDQVETNGWGMPALMDPRLIAQERDGIVITNRTQSLVSGAYGPQQNVLLQVSEEQGTVLDDYDFRVVDPVTGQSIQECTFSGKPSFFLSEQEIPESGALTLEAGYGSRMGFVVRQSVVVFNLLPGHDVQLSFEYGTPQLP